MTDRPIQVVFAGKAHPADRPGQRVIQEIFQRSRSTQLRGRVYILEDYNMRSPASSCRVWTSGSTTRGARWRRRAPPG
jgi:glucan phosphorylase